jgi:hypothetical protein
MEGFDPRLVELIRKTLPEILAYEFCSVQPMNTPEMMKAWDTLCKNSMSEQELVDAGYHPVCETTRLMWVKDRKERE